MLHHIHSFFHSIKKISKNKIKLKSNIFILLKNKIKKLKINEIQKAKKKKKSKKSKKIYQNF
jgi:hypothetical protein